MLQYNPMHQSDQIMVRRRRFLVDCGRPVSADDDPSPSDEAIDRLRSRASRNLDVLRRDFYTLDPARAAQLIKTIRHPRLPEFATAAATFERMVGFRDQVLASVEQVNDQKFVYSLCHALIQSPIAAATLGEQYIESMVLENRVKSSLAMVRQFADRHPQIVNLIPEWFETLLDAENRRHWETMPRGSSIAQAAKSHYDRSLGENRKSRNALLVFVALVFFVMYAVRINRSLDNVGAQSASERKGRAAVQPEIDPQAAQEWVERALKEGAAANRNRDRENRFGEKISPPRSSTAKPQRPPAPDSKPSPSPAASPAAMPGDEPVLDLSDFKIWRTR